MSTIAPTKPRVSDYAPPMYREPEDEPALDRLNDIALLIRSLTYDEMMQLARGFWQPMATTSPATEEELARLIHGWSVSR